MRPTSVLILLALLCIHIKCVDIVVPIGDSVTPYVTNVQPNSFSITVPPQMSIFLTVERPCPQGQCPPITISTTLRNGQLPSGSTYDYSGNDITLYPTVTTRIMYGYITVSINDTITITTTTTQYDVIPLTSSVAITIPYPTGFAFYSINIPANMSYSLLAIAGTSTIGITTGFGDVWDVNPLTPFKGAYNQPFTYLGGYSSVNTIAYIMLNDYCTTYNCDSLTMKAITGVDKLGFGDTIIASGPPSMLYNFSIFQPAFSEVTLTIPQAIDLILYINYGNQTPNATNYDQIIQEGSSSQVTNLFAPVIVARNINLAASGLVTVLSISVINRPVNITSLAPLIGQITAPAVNMQRDYYSIYVNTTQTLSISVVLNTTNPSDSITLLVGKGSFGTSSTGVTSAQNAAYYSQLVSPGLYDIVVIPSCTQCSTYTLYAYDIRTTVAPSSNNSLTPAMIVGIVVSCVFAALLALVILIIILCCCSIVTAPSWMKGYFRGQQPGIMENNETTAVDEQSQRDTNTNA
jgi:hypothetical protein